MSIRKWGRRLGHKISDHFNANVRAIEHAAHSVGRAAQPVSRVFTPAYQKRAIESGEDYSKRAVRKNATELARANVYLTGAGAFIANFIPYVGPLVAQGVVYGGAETGRYLGSAAARNDGEHGNVARSRGRDVFNRTIIVGEIGATAGLSTTFLTGTGAFIASVPEAGAAAVGEGGNAALLAGEGGQVFVNSAEVATAAEAAAPSVVTITGAATPVLVAAPEVGAVSAGFGILDGLTLGGITALGKEAYNLYKQFFTKPPDSGAAPQTDIVSGLNGPLTVGAPAGDPSGGEGGGGGFLDKLANPSTLVAGAAIIGSIALAAAYKNRKAA